MKLSYMYLASPVGQLKLVANAQVYGKLFREMGQTPRWADKPTYKW